MGPSLNFTGIVFVEFTKTKENVYASGTILTMYQPLEKILTENPPPYSNVCPKYSKANWGIPFRYTQYDACKSALEIGVTSTFNLWI